MRYLWPLLFCQGYFDTARLELAEHNIHVQTVLPGPVKSNISLNFFTENINEVRKQCFFNQYIQKTCNPLRISQSGYRKIIVLHPILLSCTAVFVFATVCSVTCIEVNQSTNLLVSFVGIGCPQYLSQSGSCIKLMTKIIIK